MTRDEIRQLLMDVRPYFKERLGKFTHKRISDDWYFHALGFVRDDMTYVFGFNIGFFDNNNGSGYKKVGMSVTIRANGLNPEIRKRYIEFFSAELKNWANQPFERYTSDRGGEGLLITRYANVQEMKHMETVKFLKECIDQFRPLYNRIASKPEVFEAVMRAGMPWDEPIVSLAKEYA